VATFCVVRRGNDVPVDDLHMQLSSFTVSFNTTLTRVASAEVHRKVAVDGTSPVSSEFL